MVSELNPIEYIIFEYWKVHEKNIKKEKILDELYKDIEVFIGFGLEREEDINYLDYTLKIDNKAEMIEIIPFNLISGLWLLNIFPINIEYVIKNNIYYIEGGNYTYNKKTKKIIWTPNK